MCFISTGVSIATPTIRPTENEVHITASVSKIQQGFTKSLDVNCSLPHNTQSEFTAVNSIILSKTVSEDDNVFSEIATVTVASRYTVDVKESLAAAVTGQLTPTQDSYISYHWSYPPSDAVGSYKCQVFGMDSTGHPIMSEAVTTVAERSVDLDMILHKMTQLEATQDALQQRLNSTTAALEKTNTLLNATTKELEGTKAELADLKAFKDDLNDSMILMAEATSTFKGHRYMYSYPVAAYSVALKEVFCKMYGGYLLEINDQQEYDFIVKFIKPHSPDTNIIIGATDRDTEGTWRFIHSGAPLTFLKWGPGEPNDGRGANCMALNQSNMLMYEVACITAASSRFICEM